MQLKIRNDFDPVLSPESSLFVLKSNKQVRVISCLKIVNLDFRLNMLCYFHLVTGGLSRYFKNTGSCKVLQLCAEFH